MSDKDAYFSKPLLGFSEKVFKTLPYQNDSFEKKNGDVVEVQNY